MFALGCIAPVDSQKSGQTDQENNGSRVEIIKDPLCDSIDAQNRLAEKLTYREIREQFDALAAAGVDTRSAALATWLSGLFSLKGPDVFPDKFSLFVQTLSGQKASAEHPRAIYWNGIDTLLAAQTSLPGAKPTLEILKYECRQRMWVPNIVIEQNSEQGPQITWYADDAVLPNEFGGKPTRDNCARCHGPANDLHPIWLQYEFWPGALGYITRDVSPSQPEMFERSTLRRWLAQASQQPSQLSFLQHRRYHVERRLLQSFNTELTFDLYRLLWHRLFHRLTSVYAQQGSDNTRHELFANVFEQWLSNPVFYTNEMIKQTELRGGTILDYLPYEPEAIRSRFDGFVRAFCQPDLTLPGTRCAQTQNDFAGYQESWNKQLEVWREAYSLKLDVQKRAMLAQAAASGEDLNEADAQYLIDYIRDRSPSSMLLSPLLEMPYLFKLLGATEAQYESWFFVPQFENQPNRPSHFPLEYHSGQNIGESINGQHRQLSIRRATGPCSVAR